jgi:hypothetical protein
MNTHRRIDVALLFGIVSEQLASRKGWVLHNFVCPVILQM